MAPVPPCPRPEELHQLLAGATSPEQTDDWLRHLEWCDPCADLAEQALAGMPLAATLAQLSQRGEEPEGPVVDELISRMQQWRPPGARDAVGRTAAVLSREDTAPSLPVDRCQAVAEACAALAGPQRPDEIGRLGPYRILEVLGAGGMGVVFRAEDPSLQRDIALKIMRPDLARRPAFRERFLHEGRAAAALEHDHVLTIYQVGEEQGLPYLVLPLLRGETLLQRLRRRGPLPPVEVLRIGREAAAGLAAAHARGLVHGDVTPSNLWLEEDSGRVKLMDFGLARRAAEAAPPDAAGLVLGTLACLAPEQLRGAPADARTDLFSLGCVLYLLCTGAVPFPGRAGGVVSDGPEPEPIPVRTLNRQVPRALAALISQLLAPGPQHRPDSAQAVVEALTRLQQHDRGRLRRGLALALALAAGVVLTLGLVYLQDGRDPATATQVAPVPATGDKAPLTQISLKSEQIPPLEKFAWQAPELVAVLGEHRGWHIGAVLCLAYQPGGKAVVTGAEDGVVRFWDPVTRRLLRALPPCPGPVTALAFDPSGTVLAAGCGNGKVHLWTVGDSPPRERAVFAAHQPGELALAFAPGGRRLTTAAGDVIKVWDLRLPRPAACAAVAEKRGPVRSLVFLTDDLLAAAGGGPTVRLWDLRGDKPTLARELPGDRHKVDVLALAPGRSLLAAGDVSHRIRLWELGGAAPQLRLVFPGFWPTGQDLAFSPDDRRLAAFTKNLQGKAFSVWDVAGLEARLYCWAPHDGFPDDWVRALAFAPNGQNLATGGDGGLLRLWQVREGEAHQLALGTGHSGSVEALAFDPNGKLITGGLDATVRLWDLTGPAPRQMGLLQNHPGRICCLALTPDGRTLAAAGDGRQIHIWDLKNGAAQERTAVPGDSFYLTALAFAPDGRTLASAGFDRKVRLWDLRSGKAELRRVLTGPRAHITELAFSSDGQCLACAVAHHLGEVLCWDLTAAEPSPRQVCPRSCCSVAFLPERRILAAGLETASPESPESHVQLWDLSAQAPKEGTVFRHQAGNADRVTFSPNGKLLAIATRQGRLFVHEATGGPALLDWKLPGMPRSVAFAPDGRHLAVAHSTGTVYVFRLPGAAGREVSPK